MSSLDRRSFLLAGGSLAASAAIPSAFAQAKPKLRFSSAFTEQDLRAEAYKNFATAMQATTSSSSPTGTTRSSSRAPSSSPCSAATSRWPTSRPQDISKQLPAWSLMTSAYLFRDSDHLKKTFKSDVGRDFIKMARDKLDVVIVTPVYFGARHVNLKPEKTIKTPADLAGIKLRMPPGEFWQFLGESIGVNPTPVAFAEVYTALQTGAIDGQDNPLLLSKLMKFYEVTTQFVLTSHVIGYDLMTVSTQDLGRDAAGGAGQVPGGRREGHRRLHRQVQRRRRRTSSNSSRAQGKKVYTPDVNAFRTYAQKKYLDKYGQDWPKGALERINAL